MGCFHNMILLKAIESNRHGKMKMIQFLIKHLGIHRVVVHTKQLQGHLTLEKELAVCHQNDYVRLL